MVSLNLSNQLLDKDKIEIRINLLKDRLNERKALWDKLPYEKKESWIKSGKDPIMTLAWQVFKYLRDNFFSEGING